MLAKNFWKGIYEIHTHEKPLVSLFVVKCGGHICKPSKYMNMHNAVIIHRCIFNYKYLCQNDKVIIYMMLHTGEKPNQCCICDKDFLFQSVLENYSKLDSSVQFNQHVLFDSTQSIHIEITHQCTNCVNYLAYKKSSEEHMLNHIDEKSISSLCVVKYVRYIGNSSQCKNIHIIDMIINRFPSLFYIHNGGYK